MVVNYLPQILANDSIFPFSFCLDIDSNTFSVRISTMAFALSQQLLCLHSPKTSPSPPSKSHKLVGNPIFSVRLWPSHCKSSPQRNSSTSLQSSPPESKPNFSPEPNGSPGDEPPSEPSLFDSISVRVRRLRSAQNQWFFKSAKLIVFAVLRARTESVVLDLVLRI